MICFANAAISIAEGDPSIESSSSLLRDLCPALSAWIRGSWIANHRCGSCTWMPTAIFGIFIVHLERISLCFGSSLLISGITSR